MNLFLIIIVFLTTLCSFLGMKCLPTHTSVGRQMCIFLNRISEKWKEVPAEVVWGNNVHIFKDRYDKIIKEKKLHKPDLSLSVSLSLPSSLLPNNPPNQSFTHSHTQNIEYKQTRKYICKQKAKIHIKKKMHYQKPE